MTSPNIGWDVIERACNAGGKWTISRTGMNFLEGHGVTATGSTPISILKTLAAKASVRFGQIEWLDKLTQRHEDDKGFDTTVRAWAQLHTPSCPIALTPRTPPVDWLLEWIEGGHDVSPLSDESARAEVLDRINVVDAALRDEKTAPAHAPVPDPKRM